MSLGTCSYVSFLVSVSVSTMGSITSEQGRKLTGTFYTENWEKGKSCTWQHFKKMKVPKSTVYHVMGRCDQGMSMKRERGSGRPAAKMPTGRLAQTKMCLAAKIGVSQ